VGESNSFPTYEEFFSKKTDDSRGIKLWYIEKQTKTLKNGRKS
jgi:hypothetical protein